MLLWEQDISVVICAYTEERWEDVVAAVESVRRQTLPATEIIIVIDHNIQLLKRVQKCISDVIVVENTEARGLSGARNSGIAAAKSQLIAFLDDDAVATPVWLASLTQYYVDNPQMLGTGGAVLPLWETAKPSWFPEEFFWVVGCTYRGMPETDAPIRNPIGANMAFRREVFSHIGGFLTGIGRIGTRPLGCEETELCIRVRHRWPQHTILYVPEASVYHHIPANRASWRYFCSRCYAEGISKATITGFIGTRDGLASERAYILQTLPQSFVLNIFRGIFLLKIAALARAGAIMAGLIITTAGYVVGRLFNQYNSLHKSPSTEQGLDRSSTDPDSAPVEVVL